MAQAKRPVKFSFRKQLQTTKYVKFRANEKKNIPSWRKSGDKLLEEKKVLIKFFIIPVNVPFFHLCFRCNFVTNKSSF